MYNVEFHSLKSANKNHFGLLNVRVFKINKYLLVPKSRGKGQ